MKYEYHHNNSGGYWWLKDTDWIALEKEGWKVEWYEERHIGALASTATKAFESLEECIKEWERITGQNAEDKGCSCCGQPHYFYKEDEL